MMLLGQYRAVLFGTWWFWVSIGLYWLMYDGAGSVQGVTFFLLKSNHWSLFMRMIKTNEDRFRFIRKRRIYTLYVHCLGAPLKGN